MRFAFNVCFFRLIFNLGCWNVVWWFIWGIPMILWGQIRNSFKNNWTFLQFLTVFDLEYLEYLQVKVFWKFLFIHLIFNLGCWNVVWWFTWGIPMILWGQIRNSFKNNWTFLQFFTVLDLEYFYVKVFWKFLFIHLIFNVRCWNVVWWFTWVYLWYCEVKSEILLKIIGIFSSF